MPWTPTNIYFNCFFNIILFFVTSSFFLGQASSIVLFWLHLHLELLLQVLHRFLNRSFPQVPLSLTLHLHLELHCRCLFHSRFLNGASAAGASSLALLGAADFSAASASLSCLFLPGAL